MNVLLLVLAWIVVAALLLAAELLRTEPISEQGLADLNQSLADGQGHDETAPSIEERLATEGGPATRLHLKRLRRDFLTAWAVCRLLGPISRQRDAAPSLYRCWLNFHWLFAAVWVKTYLGQSPGTAGRAGRLVAVFHDLRRRATALMQLDAGLPAGAGQADA